VTITNTSGSGHNITVDDPNGKEIASVEMPPKAMVSVQVDSRPLATTTFSANIPPTPASV